MILLMKMMTTMMPSLMIMIVMSVPQTGHLPLPHIPVLPVLTGLGVSAI